MDWAVLVSGAVKCYGKNQDLVLDGLNMEVPKGTIYGLLGASGCGKTTLLSCILGLSSLDKGEIWTLGGQPNSSASGVPGERVGYLPQDVSLQMDFTVAEIIHFFGVIQGLCNSRINKRMEFLLELFGIESDARFIESYSAGQQRRISLIVALLHEPELLVLDEPTVGIDSVLRQRVWNHLMYLANEEGKTIIITTHYIEETIRANNVGFMHSGKLLVQGNPNDLLCSYNVTSLDELFVEALTLFSTSQLDIQSRSPELNDSICELFKNAADQTARNHFRIDNIFRNVVPMTAKNFKHLFRNISFLLIIFLLPVIIGNATCAIMGRQMKKLPFVIVNNDMVGELCPLQNTCIASNLSCFVLQHLQVNDIFDITMHTTVENAEKSIQKGQAWGMIEFPQNFSQHFMDRIEQGVIVDNMTIESSLVSLTMDATNIIIRETSSVAVITSIIHAVQDVYNICNYTFTNPFLLKTLEPIYGEHNAGYAPLLISGGTANIHYFVISMLSSIILTSEIKDGVAHRLFVLGVSPISLISSYFLICFIVICVNVSTVWTCFIIPYGITVKGSMFWFLAMVMLQGIGGFTFGLLIAISTDNVIVAVFINYSVMVILMFMDGCMWAVEMQPRIARIIASLGPTTFPIQSLRGIMFKGWGITYDKVYPGFIVALTWICGCLLITTLIMSNRAYRK